MSHLRVSLIIVVLGSVLGVLTACGGEPIAGEPKAANQAVNRPPAKTTSSARSTRSTRPSTTSSRPRATDPLGALAGTWEGEYTCAQGTTGLRLIIGQAKDGTLPATFAFFPLPQNREAKAGAFEMLGSLDTAGQLLFRQQKWINQPDGYIMVDIAVTSPINGSVEQLSGDILEQSCKGFSVRRLGS